MFFRATSISFDKDIEVARKNIENLAIGMGIEVKTFKTGQEAKLYYAKQFAEKIQDINNAIIESEGARQSAIADGDKEAYEMATKKKLALFQAKTSKEIRINNIKRIRWTKCFKK